MSVTEELDALINELDEAVGGETGAAAADDTTVEGDSDGGAAPSTASDALDLVLGASPRRTDVKRLRDSDAVRQFREDLLNGAVRIDRLNHVLSIVALVVKQILKRL